MAVVLFGEHKKEEITKESGRWIGKEHGAVGGIIAESKIYVFQRKFIGESRVGLIAYKY